MTDKLTEVRGQLHTALVGALDLQDRRVHAYPQFGGAATPCAWVGLFTVTDPNGRGAVLEAPLVLAADGKAQDQVAWLDRATAAVWDAVRSVDAGAGRAKATVSTQDQLGPEGSSTVALTITVQVALATRTLCPQSAQLDQP